MRDTHKAGTRRLQRSSAVVVRGVVEDAKQNRGLSSNSRVQAECCERRERVARRWSEMAERRGRKRRPNRPAR